MNGIQLENCMRSDRYTRPIFEGVFAENMLPKQKLKNRPCGLIANTDPSDKPGEHWVAFYFDMNDSVEYFDSYGLTPKSTHFKNFLKLNSNKISWNSVPLQGPFSSVCGQYCLFYLLHRSRKWTMQEICGFFTRDDKNSNDFLVNEFISEHFDLNTQVSDSKFMFKQISRALLKS